MSTLTFIHPSLRDVTMNFGQFMQVVGTNYVMKQQLWQMFVWHLGSHKYNVGDVEILNNKNPKILCEEEVLTRNKYDTIIIESMHDLHEVLTIRKGTPFFERLTHTFNNLDVSQYIENINTQLAEITRAANMNAELKKINERQRVKWHVSINELTAKDVLQKYATISPMLEDTHYATEYLCAYDKYRLLLDIITTNLIDSTQDMFLLVKNLDGDLSHSEYQILMQQVNNMTEQHKHFHCLFFLNAPRYVYITENNFENILVCGDETHQLETVHFLYERVCEHYPDYRVPQYSAFLENLTEIIQYLFTDNLSTIHLPIRLLVLLKIINELYQYYGLQVSVEDSHSKLEYHFLSDNLIK